VGGLFHRTDFHGEGSSSLVGLRVRLPLSRYIVLEPGAQLTRFDRDPGDEEEGDLEVPLLALDFQLQAQLPLDLGGPDRVRPWIGVGAGGAVDFRDERGAGDFVTSTFTASLGVALDVGSHLTLLGEGRYRTLDELERRVIQASFGLGWRL
jgi:hypothetical protein